MRLATPLVSRSQTAQAGRQAHKAVSEGQLNHGGRVITCAPPHAQYIAEVAGQTDRCRRVLWRHPVGKTARTVSESRHVANLGGVQPGRSSALIEAAPRAE